MLRKQFLVCLLTVMSMLHYGAASAITLSVEPPSAVIDVGDTYTANIVISGLGDFVPPSLGAFDLSLNYDPSFFSFSSLTFGSQLDLSGLGSINGFTDTGTAVDMLEVSLDLFIDLDFGQPGAFTLASVGFEGKAAGTGVFGLTDVILSDSFGDPLFPQQISEAAVRVVAPQVIPVPAAVWLFGSALIGLIGLSRRKKLQ